MSIKTFLGSVVVIGGIALLIIGLSINHQHQQAKAAAIASPASSTALTGAAVGVVVRAQLLRANDGPFGPAGHCNIERIDGHLFTDKASHGGTSPLELTGWVVDPAAKSVPSDVGIRMEQAAKHQIWLAPLTADIKRPDVVESQNDVAAYLRSGFDVRIDPIGLPDGDYHMLIQYQSGGLVHLCDNGRILHLGG